MYLWDFDDQARQELITLSQASQAALAEFMNAVVLVDPIEYQRHSGEPTDPPAMLRTLHFGARNQGLVTFLVYPPDDLVLVVKFSGLANELFTVELGECAADLINAYWRAGDIGTAARLARLTEEA